MKRSTIETLVLIIGVAIIGIALFFMFATAKTPSSIFVTNLVFSFGFLVYIIYTIMASNSLNREIRGLNKHIEGLKTEISKYKKQLSQKEDEIKGLQNELSEKQDVITSQTEKIDNLEKKVSELQNPESPS